MENEQSGGFNRILRGILFLCAVFGVSSVYTVFTESLIEKLLENPVEGASEVVQQLVEHPWTVLSFLLIAVVVYFLGFLYKVWQQLEGELVEGTANSLRHKVMGFSASYRKRYFQHLIYRHRDFDVKGLSTQGIFTLTLQEVFVQLSIAPKAAHEATADPLQVPEQLREGQHTVWQFLAAKPMANQNLAIIGPPGSGKTTLLKHTALTLTDKKMRADHGAPNKLPILLFLRNHATTINENPDYKLAEAVHEALQSSKMSSPPPSEWFEKQLNKGQCLIMLDGLDEVAESEVRQQVARWVDQQMGAYGNNRFVVTSRPFGYRSNPLSGVTVLEVQPFTSQQMRTFVERWYLANEIMSSQKDDPGVRMKADEGAQNLLRRIRNTPALLSLAVNPLLLTMIATVHRYRSSLPGRRVELYAEICQVFLGKRQQARGIEFDLTPAQKVGVLQRMAYHMMILNQREVQLDEAIRVIKKPLEQVNPNYKGEEFLKMIENSSGLLLERENGEYSFAHLTFQEYLAAKQIVERPRWVQSLVQRVTESWWHESIRLYCAQTDATPIIAACVSNDKPSIPALTLAIECQEEAHELHSNMRDKLKMILEQGIEDNDPELRKLVAEALLALRLKRMSRINENLYVDDSLITHAEYQLFLDEQRAKRKYYQPDHWLQYRFSTGLGHKPVVGVRPADAVAFCNWLTERNKEEWTYRLPYTGEFDPLASEVGYWTGGKIEREYKLESKPSVILSMEQLKNRVHFDLVLDFDRAFHRALDRALALDLDRVLALDRARAFHLDLDRALDRALDLDFDRVLDRGLAFELALDVDLDRALAIALERALDLVLDRALDRAINNLNLEQVSEFLRWYIRLIAWLVAVSLQYGFEKWERERFFFTVPGNKERQADQELQRLAEQYFDLYIDFAILEERIEGNLPAFEGIRIVKELKPMK